MVVAVIRLSCFLKWRAVLIGYKDIRRCLNDKAEIPYDIYGIFLYHEIQWLMAVYEQETPGNWPNGFNQEVDWWGFLFIQHLKSYNCHH